ASSRAEIFPAGILRMGHFHDVRRRDSRLHAQPVRIDRGRENVEFFPAHWRNRLDCFGSLCGGFALRSELLVPVSLPYGALLGLTSWLSPTRIRRNAETCIDCGKCAKACPSALPVDKLVQIRSVECTGCLECVAVCPAQNALAMSLPNLIAPKTKPATLPAWAMAA